MDDEEMLLRTVRQFLGHLGYKVITVANGENAINEYKACQERRSFLACNHGSDDSREEWAEKKRWRSCRHLDPDVRAIVSSGYSNDPVFLITMITGFRPSDRNHIKSKR